MSRLAKTSRRVLFTLTTIILAIVVVETFSLVALYILDGQLYSPRRARIERDRVWRQAEVSVSIADVASVGQPEVIFHPNQATHPFVGYLRDPDFESSDTPISELGFYYHPPPDTASGQRVTIGVFGGSVARHFVTFGRDSLVETLKSSPAFRGKSIWVRSFAMSGFKQPQQLMSLNYLLALGEHLDIVINLDGFNDVALASTADATDRFFPFYPRHWPRRMLGHPDIHTQRTVGEISFLETKRLARVGSCDRAVLAFSPTCHLIWKRVDRLSSRRIHALRENLRTQQPGERRFLTHGPERDYSSEEDLFRDLSEVWGRSSLQMHGICDLYGARYFHFLQPNQYVPDSKTFSSEEKSIAIKLDHQYRSAVLRGYPYLGKEGETLIAAGVRFTDMRGVFEDTRTSVYEDSCCHLNQEGNDIVARVIGRVISEDFER